MAQESKVTHKVTAHYSGENIASRILDAAQDCGEIPSPETLAPYDQLHIGGKHATTHLAGFLQLKPDDYILDIGCGLGGPARYIAEHYHVRVGGLDLSPDYIQAAQDLSNALNLQDCTEFQCGSATHLPYEDNTFDAAMMIHVGMNIEDKITVYRDIFRTLKSGAFFGICDVMANENISDIRYPVPWADTQETSFLEKPQDLQKALQDCGFQLTKTEERREFSLKMLHKAMESAPTQYSSPKRSATLSNLVRNIEENCCTPVVIICQK